MIEQQKNEVLLTPYKWTYEERRLYKSKGNVFFEKNRVDYQKHNKLKWTLKDELEMLTTNELLKIKKLIVGFYRKESCTLKTNPKS